MKTYRQSRLCKVDIPYLWRFTYNSCKKWLSRTAGLVSGLRPLQEAKKAFVYPPGAAFKVAGFLIGGCTYRPWLVELKARPSMAVKASLLASLL